MRSRQRTPFGMRRGHDGRRCGRRPARAVLRTLAAERLERRDLLAVSIARTTLNLRFSVDVRPATAAYGEYQAFAVTNDGPTALADVWVKATNFPAAQKVQLGPAEDGLYPLGNLGAGAANAETAFIYLVSQEITNPPALDEQSYTIEVWQGRPGSPGAILLGSQNEHFEWVGEAIHDDSSSRTFSVNVGYAYDGVPTAGPVVGGTMTMTVTGDVKNKPDRILFSPATALGWPADAFVLEDAVVTYSRNPQLPPDVIFEKPIPPASTPKDFTAVYTFRVAAATAAPTPVNPVQYTANGADLASRKFDHSEILEGVPDIPPAIEATDLQITKTGATTAVAGSATQYSYTVTVASTGAYAAQGVVVTDAWPAAFIRLPITPPPGTAVATTPAGFTWTIGSLPAGGVAQLTVNFTVPAGTPPGPFTNTAVVSSSTPDPGPVTAQVTTTVVSAPVTADLAIEKNDFTPQYTPGQPITWRIVVTNRGPSAVAGARVQDVLPPQVSGASWTAAFTGGSGATSGSGNIDERINLSAGGTAVYTVTAATFSTALGNLVNTSTVAAPTGVADPNLSNNQSTHVDLVAPVADLAITKVDASPTYVPGLATIYTVTVTNNGPSFVAGATVTDMFSTAFTGVTWTAVFTGSGSSGATAGSGNLAQTINLAAGGTAVYTITAWVNPAATASIVNTASVTAPLGTTDPNPANNSATDTNTASPRVFLAITKTDGTGMYVPGETTTYTITVANTGPSFLTGGRLVDVFPAAIVGATWTASYGDSGSGGPGSGSGNIDATFTLAVGGTATFTVTAPVTDTAEGNLVNTATISVPAGTTNTNPVTSATDIDTPAPLADLRIAKTDGTTTYVPGTTTTYTITVANFGPSAVRGARIVDTFDPTMLDVAGITWTAVLQDGSTLTGTGSIDLLLDVAHEDLDKVITFTVTAPILAGATGVLSNTATVAVPPGTTDPNPANDTAVDVDVPAVTPVVYADLSIEKRDFVQQYAPGQTLTWTITVINAGPNGVTDARLFDAFPAQVESVTWTAIFTAGGGTASGSGTVIDQLVALAAGGRAVYTVVAQTSPTATGALTNVATITAPAGVTDPNPTNNTWTDVDQVAPSADLVLTKTDPAPTYVPGETTVYTVTVINAGPSAVTGARVVDTFSSLFTAVSWTASFSAGSSGAPSGTGNIDALVTLAAGGSVVYAITATTSPWASVDIVNTATVTAPVGTTDPNLGNNTDTHTNVAASEVFLDITKTDNTGFFVPGEALEYVITVTNSGPSALVGGRLRDALPAVIKGATWTASYSGSGSSGPGSGSGDIDATLTLAVGGRATFTVTAPVVSTARGRLVNTATVSVPVGTTNTNPVTSATDTDLVTPVADLRVFKTDATSTYTPGTPLTYTITVSNYGPSAVEFGHVVDTFDPAFFDVAGVRWTMRFPDGSTRTGSGNIDQVFDLDRGDAERVITIEVAAPVRATARGPLANTATVEAPVLWLDYNLTNNRSTHVDLEAPRNGLVTGTDDGCPSAPVVRILDPDTGAVLRQFRAYEAGFRGGVRVAVADFDGDGYDEIVTAPGRSRPGQIRVWTQQGVELVTWRTFPFGRGYTGGVEVTTGDVDGDGRPDLIASMSAGANARVSAFLVTPTAADPVADVPYRTIVPFPGRFTGGVTIAATDLGSFVGGTWRAIPDGFAEVIAGSNAGMPATVKVFDLSRATPRVAGSFHPIGSRFTGGVTLATGRWTAGSVADILVGAGVGGGSVVETWSGATFTRLDRITAFSSFRRPNARVSVAALDTDGDGVIDTVSAVQGQQGAKGTPGVTTWSRLGGTTRLLPLSAGLQPPLRIAAMTKRRL